MVLDDYGATADFYDQVVPYRDRTDVGFYLDAARESGSPVLELGCGTGRILIPTARAGIDITGLDGSPRMLSLCRERLAAEPAGVQSRVQLVQAPLTAFDLGRSFRLVTIPFRPFQHLLTVDDQLACLACIRRHLAPEGRLVFDLFNPSIDAIVNSPVGVEMNHEPEFTTPDGRRVIRCNKTIEQDRYNQVGHHELIYNVTHPDGRTERLVHSFALRYLFRFEAEHLLVRAGFQVEQIYAGPDKSAYGSRYPGELFFVARAV
jgi:SAM-dependent methyltransferase